VDRFDPSETAIDDIVDAALGEGLQGLQGSEKGHKQLTVDSIDAAFAEMFDESSGAFLPPPGLENLRPLAELEGDYEVSIQDEEELGVAPPPAAPPSPDSVLPMEAPIEHRPTPAPRLVAEPPVVDDLAIAPAVDDLAIAPIESAAPPLAEALAESAALETSPNETHASSTVTADLEIPSSPRPQSPILARLVDGDHTSGQPGREAPVGSDDLSPLPPPFSDVPTQQASLQPKATPRPEVATAPQMVTGQPAPLDGLEDERIARTPSAPWLGDADIELPAPGMASELSERLVVPAGPVARLTPAEIEALDSITPGPMPLEMGTDDLLPHDEEEDATLPAAGVAGEDAVGPAPVVTRQPVGEHLPTEDAEQIPAEIMPDVAVLLPPRDDLLETQNDAEIPKDVPPEVKVATVGEDEPLAPIAADPSDPWQPPELPAVPINLTTADIADVVDIDGSLDFDAIVTWDTEVEGRRASDVVELISTGRGEAAKVRAAAEEALRARLDASFVGTDAAESPRADAPRVGPDSDDVHTKNATYIPIRPLGTARHATQHLVCRYAPDGSAAPCVLRWMDDSRGLGWQPRRARFLAEASIGKRLHHPNVVRVHDVGERRERPFLIREFVSGASLRELIALAGTPLPIPVSVAIVRHVAEALRYVHNKASDRGNALDLVHGELNPSRILVSLEGVVKITSVGVTRLGDAVLRGPTGGRKGDASYGAPEQRQGLAIDARADIFSLGLILGELVIGRPLLADRSTRLDDLEDQIWNDCASRDEVPGPLVQLIVKMIHRKADKRPAKAGDVVDALTEISEHLGGAPDLAAELAPLFQQATPVVPVSHPAPSEAAPVEVESVSRTTALMMLAVALMLFVVVLLLFGSG